MNKEALLTAITEASAAKKVSYEDVIGAFRRGTGEVQQPQKKSLSLINILYAIGGIIVCIGLVLFVHQQWSGISSAARIAITLGSGIAAYIAGTFILRAEGFRGVAFSFFLLFSLLTPFGLFVTLHESHYYSETISYSDIIYMLMFTATTASIFVTKQSLFRVFSIIFGSLLYFSATHSILQGSGLNTVTMLEYRFLLLGTSYLLLGYGLSSKFRTLTAWLYAAGSLMFLGASFALGGFKPDVHQIWEIAFVGICFAGMGLSVYLKSKAMLIIASLYLMAFILKLTAEYFSDTIGWPLALIGAGFMLIAIGYGTYAMSQRYLNAGQARPGE
ncbi:MAG: hypothetical protein A3E36_01200 [Candidatus Andersenbacteria bacterium RIFCSPHIGHO2_12_FULL_45_11b]|uniref:DUF2157 domain-containing protein n=1 Tax=Candidatus Andersenbacteria bacterium RIFCSPHIGHO2_12_FULL_45_11b TaxID=1797282 RepID=A0A1G1XB45_9BACT|nr:MAG: hypothetical protein A3E36_01200 [Candidatus Andersenbacteria bacterium RIFCSPHIGHO2_12_FULL_45_11b]